MELKNRISAFAKLGDAIKNLIQEKEFEKTIIQIQNQNAWFTPENTIFALNQWANCLTKNNLEKWLLPYEIEKIAPKKIGIVMAGNIPLVGFHDLLSVLITGNIAMIKPSSQDEILIKLLAKKLISIESSFENKIEFVEQLKNFDAVIATGSNNTSRYFEYYFKDKPHIIRKNRTSVAILNGKEIEEDFFELRLDIFHYFGLGCRNVSKLFVPKNYDFIPLMDAMESYKFLKNHHKYFNNFEYNLTLLLMNKIHCYANEFMAITKNEDLVSSIAMVYYEEYENEKDLNEKLQKHQNQIQCITSKNAWLNGSIPLGEAQTPDLSDYADGVDTIDFCLSF